MTKSYADTCIERAEKAIYFDKDAYLASLQAKAELDYHAVETVYELARRLQKACAILRLLGSDCDHDIPRWIDELEAMPEEK